MIAADNELSERERQLGELIFACLNTAQDSQTVGVQEVMAHHPEFADELAEFFAGRACRCSWFTRTHPTTLASSRKRLIPCRNTSKRRSCGTCCGIQRCLRIHTPQNLFTKTFRRRARCQQNSLASYQEQGPPHV